MSSPVWEIWQNTHRNPAAIKARQQRRLAELVRFARQHSPFYRKLYGELPLEIQDIHLLPAVTKADLMAHFDDWVTDPAVTRAGVDAFVADKTLVGQPYLGHYFLCTTSGTTGTPGIFLHDPEALQIYRALLMVRGQEAWLPLQHLKTLLHTGLRHALVVATGGHFGSLAWTEWLRRQHPWLFAQIIPTRIFSVMKPLPELVEDLNAFQPVLLTGYTTALVQLAEEQAAGRLHITPMSVSTGGEWVSPTDRMRMAAAFHCPIVESYGASECAGFAFACKEGRLHVNTDWMIMEPMDETYQPIPVGQPSRTVLVTNLANRVQPFLRYDLGDSITVRPDPCPCGSPLPAIRVEGRQDEILHVETMDGKGIALLPMALSTVVEETPGVRRFQIIQTTPSTLRIRLEEAPGADETQVWALVTNHLREYLATQGVLSVAFEKDLERPRPHPVSGKFRHVWTELEASGTASKNVMAHT